MTEETRILAEVERRRQRAKELGLLDLMRLFLDHLTYLKKGQNPEILPKSVTNVDVDDLRVSSDSDVKMRGISFGDRSYLFIFRENNDLDPGGEPYTTGHLLLVKDGQTVFDLYCLGEHKEWIGMVWKPFRVEAFIEGIWVQEIKLFSQEVLALAEQRRTQSQEETKIRQLEDLKKKFGLT